MISGSALRRLSAITGLEALKESDGCYGLEISPSVKLFSFIKDEKTACEELRQVNWRRVCRIVFERQEWKCAECGQFGALQGHHVRFKSRWRRSDGPLDHESNVKGVDQSCHEKEHGR